MAETKPRTTRQPRITCEECGASFFEATFDPAGACEHLQAKFADKARKGATS